MCKFKSMVRMGGRDESRRRVPAVFRETRDESRDWGLLTWTPAFDVLPFAALELLELLQDFRRRRARAALLVRRLYFWTGPCQD